MERFPGKEGVQSGELYWLAHSSVRTPDFRDGDLCAGYGITTQVGRRDRLVGLLMVDRPNPVDPAWLMQVEQLYGDCQLVPMTDKGERGLLCQMRIAADSLPYLQRLSYPKAQELQEALTPLLENPPAPILKLSWDQDQQLWASQFWVALPQPLQEVFDRTGPGCFAAERLDMVSFVTHLPSSLLARFRGAPVEYRWELVKMPSAPLIRFRAAIHDDPDSPYLVEHFLNVASPDQARALSRLVTQKELAFDFFGDEYEYDFSKYLPHPEHMQNQLHEIVRMAIEHYGEIPKEQRDFDQAKAIFQRLGFL